MKGHAGQMYVMHIFPGDEQFSVFQYSSAALFTKLFFPSLPDAQSNPITE